MFQVIKCSCCLQFDKNVCSPIPHNTVAWHVQPDEIVRSTHYAEQAQTTFETTIDNLECLAGRRSRPCPSLLFWLESNCGAFVMNAKGIRIEPQRRNMKIFQLTHRQEWVKHNIKKTRNIPRDLPAQWIA